jgi:hypothetical protein
MASREQNTRGAMGTGRRRVRPDAGVMAGADFDAAPSLSEAMGLEAPGELRIFCIPCRDEDEGTEWGHDRWFVVNTRTGEDWECWSRQDAAETRRELLAT